MYMIHRGYAGYGKDRILCEISNLMRDKIKSKAK